MPRCRIKRKLSVGLISIPGVPRRRNDSYRSHDAIASSKTIPAAHTHGLQRLVSFSTTSRVQDEQTCRYRSIGKLTKNSKCRMVAPVSNACKQPQNNNKAPGACILAFELLVVKPPVSLPGMQEGIKGHGKNKHLFACPRIEANLLTAAASLRAPHGPNGS